MQAALCAGHAAGTFATHPAAVNIALVRSRMCSNRLFPKFAPPYTRATTTAYPTALRALSSARIAAPPRDSPSSSNPLSTFAAAEALRFFAEEAGFEEEEGAVTAAGHLHALMA